MPKVSVIVPCYNHAHYLPDAINSILAQTFQDWEAIIVDDGSTDNTREIAAQFTNPCIRYTYQENRGLSSARNAGIRAARGELIALLDADDMWKPTFLEMMVGVLDADDSLGGAYCGFRYMDANGNPLPTAVCRAVPPDRFRTELLKGSWLSACSVVVRCSVYQEVGIFDEALRSCEDYDMWLRISERHRFAGVPEVLLWYRRLGNNMSDDIDRMSKALEVVLEKHLGSLTTPIETWSELKRVATSQLYSLRTQSYLAQGRVEESVENLLWLLRFRPNFALSLDLWYSLACVHQLVGQRGDFDTWDPERGEADVMAVLEQLPGHGVPRSQLRVVRGQAHFALALLNYGKGRLGLARRLLSHSVQYVPGLVAQISWLRLAGRLLPGVTHLRFGTQGYSWHRLFDG